MHPILHRLAVLLAAALGACAAPAPRDGAADAPARAAARPNILLIVADDLGYSDLGSFGGEIETPTLDRLAARGLVLTNFHAGATCSPTRAMLLSGVDHHRAGLGAMAETLHFSPQLRGKPGYEGHLNDRVVTLATLLREAGYSTQMVGKWHLGYEPPDLPPARGFERSLVLLPGGAHHFDAARALPFDPEATLREDGREAAWPAGRYSSDHYTERMIEYLRSAPADRPFFAYVAYTAPHWPLQAPADYLRKYAGRYAAGWDAARAARLERMQRLGLITDAALAARRPAAVPAWTELSADQQARAARLMEIYAAMVDNLDANVARLIAELERSGRSRNTVIVFMSDNGAEAMTPEGAGLPGLEAWVAQNCDNRLENLGHRGSFAAYGPGWAHVSNAPFRGFKGSAYEGGTRAPAFIVVPDGPARRVDRHVSVVDVAPTLLRLARVAPPVADRGGRAIHAMEGEPLLTASGDLEPAGTARVAAQELFGHRGVRRGSLKAVSRWRGRTGPAPWQLFDLAADPGEQRDLAARRPEDLAALVALYGHWEQTHGVLEPSREAPGYGQLD